MLVYKKKFIIKIKMMITRSERYKTYVLQDICIIMDVYTKQIKKTDITLTKIYFFTYMLKELLKYKYYIKKNLKNLTKLLILYINKYIAFLLVSVKYLNELYKYTIENLISILYYQLIKLED